ncbi:MAG: PiT family inorganic phosphate transporter [Myxococcota bacterium]|jgi:PiT family inorganic phosphate transporter
MEIIAASGPIFIVLAVLFGLYMTWGIGANDVANAMGTSVGSGAITVKQAIVIAAIFEFSGAFLAGGHVTKTIRKGIIDPASIIDQPEILVYGMIASLLAAGIWLMVASRKGWPVSTTHTIVGAVVGFGMVGIGMDAIQWGKLGQIVASWVISPVVGGLLSFLLMLSIRQLILETDDPFRSAQRWGPIYVFLVGFIISLVTIFKGLKHLNIDLSTEGSLGIAVAFGVLCAGIGHVLIQRVEPSEENAIGGSAFAGVEKVFTPMMIFTACAMAFAHGSNDVANGVGPMAAVVSIVNSGGNVAQSAALPVWILILGGVGIIVGLATMGYRVMQTIGKDITTLTPSRGFCATLAAAATVVIASRTGLPVSTTHVAVGAVIGVGLAQGLAALDLRVIGMIAVSWFITLPVGGVLSAIFFFVLKGIFG